MRDFEQLLEELEMEGRQKLSLPNHFDPIAMHTNNQQQRKHKVKILHAGLEYGMPDHPGNVAVGGVGSLLSSLLGAQKKQPDTDARVVLPYYPNLHKNLNGAVFILTVRHWFKAQSVQSKVYKRKNEQGVTQYLIEADERFITLFSALNYSNFIYSDVNNVSRFVDRVGYFCGAAAAFAMVGDGKFLPHIMQGHSWGLCFLGNLIKEYRKLYADVNTICSPQTIFTTHSVHDGDGTYNFSELPDIGIARSEKSISLTKEIADGYDHLVYVSEQLLKETVMNPSGFSKYIFERYSQGHTSAILNNIFADQFDPAICLPPDLHFDNSDISSGKRRLKEHLNKIILSAVNKKILLDKPTTLFFGRLSEEKGIRKIALAIEVTLKNGGTFICMGVGNHSVVRGLAVKYAQNQQVIFFTTAEQQKAYGKFVRALADIYFVPSKMEACGLVPMEANLFGAPIVASKVGGLINVVISNANGLLFHDDESLKQALNQLQSYWQELYDSGNLNIVQQMIQESARNSYDWHSPTTGSAKAYRDLYMDLGDARAMNKRMIAHENALSLAILQNNEVDISRLLRKKLNIDTPNYIGIKPQELATRLNRFDLVARIRFISNNQNGISNYKRRQSHENVVLLNMCFEYKQVRLGGVGETVTALCDSINRKTKELGIEARVITPHYPWHDVLLENGTLKLNDISWDVTHLYMNQVIRTVVTSVNNDGLTQYLVRPINGHLGSDLFVKTTPGQAAEIYDIITPKLAYFNSAVAAFVSNGQADMPRIDILNGHSWGCGLAAKLLKDYYHTDRPKTVLTVHSEFSEQGVIPAHHEHADYLQGIGLRFMYGVDISPLTEGIAGSDHVVYVSKDLAKQAHKHTGRYSVRDICNHYATLRRSSAVINNISNAFNPENLNLDLSNPLLAKRDAKILINNLIQLSTPINQDEVDCFANKYIDPNKNLTLFLGRFLHEKGINNLKSAIEATLNNSGCFVVMGLYGGMQEDADIKSLAVEYRDNPNVIILHEKTYTVQKKYGPLLRFASILTYVPSHRESCGLVAMEAQQNMNYVICADTGGLKDTVFHNKNGFMYYNGKEGMIDGRRNTKEVVSAVYEAHKFLDSLAMQPERLNELLIQIYEHCKVNYVWEGSNSSLLKYTGLIKTLDSQTNTAWTDEYTSLWDLPENCRSKLNFKAGDIYTNLPKNYVLHSDVKETIFEISGYPHYLMRTSCSDIIGIFSNGKNGLEKSKVILGKGALGEVYLGQLLHSLSRPHLVGKFLAIKKQNLLPSQEAITQLRTEMNILAKEESLLLPYLQNDEQNENCKYLFLNIYEGKPLIEAMKAKELTMSDKLIIAYKLVNELSRTHKLDVLHLDLHNRNVMVAAKIKADRNDMIVRLIDFGASKIMPTNSETIKLQEYMQDAPQEVFNSFTGKYTDVYCLGVCLAKLFLDELQKTTGGFLSSSCIGSLVADRKASTFLNLPIPSFHSHLDRLALQNIKSIVAQMLQPNFKLRPTAIDCAIQLQQLYNDYLTENLSEINSEVMPENLQVYLKSNDFDISNLNAINSSGHTPLTYLYKNRNNYEYLIRKDLARELVKFGADVTQCNKYSLTPTYFALQQTDFDMNDLLDLIFLGAQLHPIETAALNLPEKEHKLLKMYLFHVKNRFGSFNPACINDLGYTPLTKAVHDNDLEMVKILIEADPLSLQVKSKYGYVALQVAQEGNNREIIEYLQNKKLIAYNFELNDIKNGDASELSAVKLFLADNNFFTEIYKINQYNPGGHTPLTKAATLENIKMINLLVKYGAGVNIPNAVGNIALHNAVDTKNVDLIDCLLNLGSDPGFINDNGYTAVQIAAEHKSSEIESKLYVKLKHSLA